MNVLFLIVARGGSKGIPGKNLREVGGIPLVGFKAISAQKSKYCTRLIISTDSLAIQKIALEYGAEVPFTRPDHLATDTASSEAVILHAMDFIENETNEQYDALMLLEPSSPFARHIDYDKTVEIMLQHNANLVVGLRRVEVSSVFVGPLGKQGRITQIIDQIQKLRSTRRQDVQPEYTMNGALYLINWEFLKKNRGIYTDRDKSFGYVMDQQYGLEIEDLGDLDWANYLVTNGHVDLAYWR